MLVHFFFIFVVIEAVLGQRCGWIDAITTRKAAIQVALFFILCSLLTETIFQAQGLDSGLHRRLVVNLEIGSSNRFVDCLIADRFMIPAGAYVDINSLKGLRAHTVAKAQFDVEAPKEKSNSTPLYVCSKRALRKNFVYSEHFELPVHLRYHAAIGKDVVVTIPAPELLLSCAENSTFLTSQCRKYLIKAPCDCSSESRCEWLMMPFLEYNAVEFKVPTGDASSLRLVFFMTVFVVIGCTVALVIVSLKNAAKTKVE